MTLSGFLTFLLVICGLVMIGLVWLIIRTWPHTPWAKRKWG